MPAVTKRLDAAKKLQTDFPVRTFLKLTGLIFIASLSAAGETPADAAEISWKTLRGLNLKSGKMSDLLTKLNGKPVKIPGFMVPLDDMEYESVGRFLLVPDPQSCIHVPPPPANQMIFVVMKGKKKAPVTWGMPVVLMGELKVKSIRSQFGVVSFQVSGEAVTPYKGK